MLFILCYLVFAIRRQRFLFLFLFLFFMSMDVVLLYWYFTLYQKVRNYKILLCSIFSKITLTLAFSSTPKESRFTCTVVRPLGIVAIGIRAARVWPSDTLIDVYRYIANKQLTKIYKWLRRSATLLDIHIWFVQLKCLLLRTSNRFL